jgi:hypothetical protein
MLQAALFRIDVSGSYFVFPWDMNHAQNASGLLFGEPLRGGWPTSRRRGSLSPARLSSHV